MNVYDDFHRCLEQLVLLNKVNRFNHFNDSKSMMLAHFAHEFCTIRCDIGRQVGKSQYIKKYHNNCGTLVVVPKKEIANNMMRSDGKFKPNYDVLTISDILNGGGIPLKTYSTIIFDEIELVAKRCEVDEMIHILFKDKSQTIIKLGM